MLEQCEILPVDNLRWNYRRFYKGTIVVIEINGKVYESKEAIECKKCSFYPCEGKDKPPICVDIGNVTVIWIPVKKTTVYKLSKMVLN